MKIKNKYINVIIIGIMFVLIVGIVPAYDGSYSEMGEDIINYPPDNWLGRIISKIQSSIYKVGTFSVYGDELGCAKYPTETWTFKKGQTFKVGVDSGDAGFVNWFRGSPYDGTYSNHPGDSRQFIGEDYIEHGKKSEASFTCDSSAYWDQDCYVDFYLCPSPCYSDSECKTGESCDKSLLSQKIPNAGVCRISIPTHKTKVYRCANGTKTYLEEVIHGDINFCTDPSDFKYLVGTTDQCLPYEPSICNTVPTNGVDKRASYDQDEVFDLTSFELEKGICKENLDCSNNSTCKKIQGLVDKNDISEQHSKDLRNSFCVNTPLGSPLIVWYAFTDKDITSSCLTLTGKQDYFNYNFGICIDKEKDGGDLCSFFEKASFFEITKNPCTDGAIIMVGGILFFIILLKKMVYGRYEYEI